MKLNFRFSNLIGTVYRKGNVLFTPDGDTVISPVGNKITFYNLKDHHSETLPIECSFDIVRIELDVASNCLLVFDEKGECYYVSLISQTIIHRHSFFKPVKACKFSPDSKYFVVCRDTDALLFHAPGLQTGLYNPFFLDRTYKLAHDSIVCLDWSHDSKLFVSGSLDSVVRVCATQRYKHIYVCNLAGHSSAVVACFFEEKTYDVYSVDRQGNLICWKCTFDESSLQKPSNFDENLVPEFNVKQKFGDEDEQNASGEIANIEAPNKSGLFKRQKKYSFSTAVPGSGIQLVTAVYHKKNRLLITGHSNGTFVMHEMPEFNLIHSLNISDQSVSSLAINCTGDWLAVASSHFGQLLVWEWQSETYVMKQQGHFHNMNCVAYSPDGQYIATGGVDAKVKIWTVNNGFCFVTFTEHTGNITGIAWTEGGKAVITSSLDGTVRAFDLKRYRNFRTFVSPEPAQFSCVAVDNAGDLVCAGCQDIFDIFVWSINTGKLLEVLTGHEAPVTSLHFNPSNSILASGSWDKSLRLWDIVESKQGKDIVTHSSDVLCVQFSPDGKLVACCTLNSQIFVYDSRDVQQIACIEGRLDLDVGRGETDEITQKKLAPSRSFTTICFSANNEFIIAGGSSRNVCIYHLEEQLLVKKFQITCNRSLNYVSDDLDRRKMSEFGNLALIDGASDSDDGSGVPSSKKIKLPGVKSGDLGQRSHRPDIKVFSVQFAPTGRAWAACTTEGLLVYSLDNKILFDPYQLETNITPSRIHSLLRNEEYGEALMMALKLNEQPLISECIEKIPTDIIDFVCRSMPIIYVEKLLAFLGSEQFSRTNHVEFYLIWINRLLMHHTAHLKSRHASITSVVNSLQQVISRRHQEIRKICDHNKYSLDYIASVRTARYSTKKEKGVENTDDEFFGETVEEPLMLQDNADNRMES